MILKVDAVLKRLDVKGDSRLIIEPTDRKMLADSNSTSVDLRLGTRFLSTKHSRNTMLDIENEMTDINKQSKLTQSHYIPFGKPFVLHPRDFVLGVTLEWIKLPFDLSGYVQGKSSWGRRGLVIATAVGVHSGFTGCLTLELTNLGEVPVAIYPGMKICQLFVHTVDTKTRDTDQTILFGKARPVLGNISLDATAKKLGQFKL